MTQTDQWGTTDSATDVWGEPDNQWGDPSPDNDQSPTWGDDDSSTQWGAEDSATQDAPMWGEDTEDSSPGWGDSSEDSTPEWGEAAGSDVMSSYWDTAPEGTPDPEPDWEDEYEDEDSSPVLSSPSREGTLPKKKLFMVGGGAVAVLALLVGGFTLIGGGDDAPEEPVPAVAEEDPAPAEDDAAADAELAQFDDFTSALESALNDRDVEAYYNLFSADSQKSLKKDVAQDAIDALPSGARYAVKVDDGSVAGSTGALKMTLERTQAGSSVDQAMNAELVKEGNDWKMVVTPKDQ